MYRTLSQGSPCLKTTPSLPYVTKLLWSPVDPGKAWTSNFAVCFDSVAGSPGASTASAEGPAERRIKRGPGLVLRSLFFVSIGVLK